MNEQEKLIRYNKLNDIAQSHLNTAAHELQKLQHDLFEKINADDFSKVEELTNKLLQELQNTKEEIKNCFW